MSVSQPPILLLCYSTSTQYVVVVILACAYPLVQVLEQAWCEGRLVLVVPWIVEYLKMMVRVLVIP